jgi:hypothetical protein
MAHFAKIENNIVTQVVVVDNEHESYGEQYLNDLGLEGKWVQTSYNGNIRRKYAGIGDIYDESDDTFKPSKPAEDWVWNEELWTWIDPNPVIEEES